MQKLLIENRMGNMERIVNTFSCSTQTVNIETLLASKCRGV